MQSYSEVEPQFSASETSQAPFSLGAGVLTWVVSIALLLGLQVVAVIIYFAVVGIQTGNIPTTPESILTKGFALMAIASTFIAHILTVLFCWLLITKRLHRSFFPTLGWDWHPQFKWPHALVLGGLMFGFAQLLAYLLPAHHETDMEKMLKLGSSVRLTVAILAVFSAPFVEEFVYRGILYPAVESKAGWMVGITVTSLLFALVHVPQYWGSPAALTAIMILSVVLTALRAYTGSLLPCVVTHFVFNGIQSVLLVLGLTDDGTKQQAKQAMIMGGSWLGLW